MQNPNAFLECKSRMQVWNEMLEELTDDGFPGELLGGEAAGGSGGESGGRLGHERGFLVSGRSAIRHVGPLPFRVRYHRQPTNQLKTRTTPTKITVSPNS